MLTYTYKLYKSKRTDKLDDMFREACFVWNHAIALQRRYYSLFGKYIDVVRIQKFFAKRIKRTLLNSQTVQELLQRLDFSYKRFFKHLSLRPPKFRRLKDFSSIVYKLCGYKLESNSIRLNSINQHFKFSLSRQYEGRIRRIRIKRNRIGDYFLLITTDASATPYRKSHNGASVGIDFGLKTFLTLSDGSRIENPLFLKSDLKKIRERNKAFSKSQDSSKNKESRLRDLERIHIRIRNRREDWQWKICHDLCKRYDTICIEDLNLSGMSRRWGQKVHDVAYGNFVLKLHHIANKYGVEVVKVNRFFASSKTCSVCQNVNELLLLSDRHWVCPKCGAEHDRDLNAAINILRQGIASSGSTHKTVVSRRRTLSTGESPY